MTNRMRNFEKTPKQIEAVNLIGNNTTTLLEGGSRSGKTVIALHVMVVRALHYPGTWHLAARLRFNHARTSLWQKTLPDVLKFHNLDGQAKYNHSDTYVEIGNGSRILIGGLDDKDRVEKILGNEYATIFLNEASQIMYDSVEIIMTRLNPPKGVPARCMIDFNPPAMKHWGYSIFHKRVFPDGRPVPADDYAVIKMNPGDNLDNISENYMARLEGLSGRRRKRFLHGDYGEEEGALWKREWFKYRTPPVDMRRVVIGVDPSGSKEGDEIGIIAVGRCAEGKYWVMGDYSLHGTPNEWSNEVMAAYDNKQADAVVAEKNYGGDMVESTITRFGARNINVKMVSATRGKQVRAEPISALYEQGLVYHTEPMAELEDELVTTKFEELEKSPNRLDALVWALTELASEGDLNIKWI